VRMGGYKVSPTPLLGGPPPPLSYYHIRHPYTAIIIAIVLLLPTKCAK
jgi:hypothetical protein